MSDLDRKRSATKTGLGDEGEQQCQPQSSLADLVVEPEDQEETRRFNDQLGRTLHETEAEVRRIDASAAAPSRGRSWERAREVVEEFRPVPWFIWRMANYVFGQPGQCNELSEGMVFGLRRLMFATASDPVLGVGEKVNDSRRALKIVPPDVVAAVSVVHAVCRRMRGRPFERIWRPILDDALLRARIGHLVGSNDPGFSAGRGMLAGFAGRCGLVILIASGNLDQARLALEMLASGTPISVVGADIYECEPLQVSALTLSAAGCGRDAAFGTGAYALRDFGFNACHNLEQQKWLAAFVISEGVRSGRQDQIDESSWTVLGYLDLSERDLLLIEAKKIIRQGHGWSWLV